MNEDVALKPKQSKYTADNIQVLEGLEAISKWLIKIERFSQLPLQASPGPGEAAAEEPEPEPEPEQEPEQEPEPGEEREPEVDEQSGDETRN